MFNVISLSFHKKCMNVINEGCFCQSFLGEAGKGGGGRGGVSSLNQSTKTAKKPKMKEDFAKKKWGWGWGGRG
jgi:hypothetical protein